MSTRHTCHVECFPLTSLLSRASYERGQAVSGCSRTGPLRWASLPAPAALENASAAVVLGFGAVLVCDKTCGLQFKPPPPQISCGWKKWGSNFTPSIFTEVLLLTLVALLFEAVQDVSHY